MAITNDDYDYDDDYDSLPRFLNPKEAISFL